MEPGQLIQQIEQIWSFLYAFVPIFMILSSLALVFALVRMPFLFRKRLELRGLEPCPKDGRKLLVHVTCFHGGLTRTLRQDECFRGQGGDWFRVSNRARCSEQEVAWIQEQINQAGSVARN